MEFNPHASTLTALNGEIAKKRKASEEHAATLAWHAALDPLLLASDIAALDDNLLNMSGVLIDLEHRMSSSQQTLEELRGKLRRTWNPLHWVSAERRRAKQELKRASESVSELAEQRFVEAEKRNALETKRTAKLGELSKYRMIDVGAVRAEHEQFHRDIESLHGRVVRTQSLWENVERALAAPRGEYGRLTERGKVLIRDIERAERVEKNLSNASNSYERAMIHEECERLFGDGKPARVCGKLRSELRRVEADKGKLRDRLTEIGRRASREIRKLVVDGSNMCFEGKSFLGLEPVKAVARLLAERFEIIVVFDATICPLLRLNKDEILREFDDAVEVHVVPARTRADETVLALAKGDHAYAISNDRFADFRDKDPVRGARVIRHEIVDGRVLIHELDVDVTFVKEPDRRTFRRGRER